MAKIWTVYEVRYFYAGIAALGRHKGTLREPLVGEVIRQELVRFNNNRNRKYNLPSRSMAFHQTPYHVLHELLQYKLVQISTKIATETEPQGTHKEWALTETGWQIYELLKNSANSQRLREEFARLALDTFEMFSGFINALNDNSYNRLVGIPYLNSKEFEEFTAEQLVQAVDYATQLLTKLLESRFHFHFEASVYERYRDTLRTVVGTRLGKGKKLATLLEIETIRFFTDYFFKGIFTNQVQYEVVRTRAVFLGLANYYRVGSPSCFVELVYPTSRLSSVPASQAESSWRNLPLSHNYLWLTALPSKEPANLKSGIEKSDLNKGQTVLAQLSNLEATTARFIAAIRRAYSSANRPTGYAEVADLRDAVCFELRIPDYLFDELLRQCVIASQNDKLPFKIYLDSSLSQPVTVLKRAPLDLKENTFNLIRINSLK